MSTFTIKLLNFEGAFNLPLWVADEMGFFEDSELSVESDYTRGSVDMVNRLASGEAQIALTSVDNVIAYSTGHGEASGLNSLDLVAFMGGDRGMLSLVSRKELGSVSNLRGATIAVDAITTGFAFALRKILKAHGVEPSQVNFVAAGGTGNRFRQLIEGKYDGTLVRTPFEVLAKTRGFNVLAAVSDIFPNYLGTVGAARRDWICANHERVVAFMLAYRQALKWIFDKSNANAACSILLRRFEGLSEEESREVYTALLDQNVGLIPDMSIPDEGVAQVKSIRNAETSQGDIGELACVDRNMLIAAMRELKW